MIVDEADRDIDMAADPFLEAGIDIPKELPYQERKPTLKMKISSYSHRDQPDNISTAGKFTRFVKGIKPQNKFRVCSKKKGKKVLDHRDLSF